MPSKTETRESLALDPSHIRIVLVRARNPNNIGAVARAMHDFGFPHLALVTDYPVPFESARSAIDASAVLTAAVVFTALPEALAGSTFIVGTTAVGERDVQHAILALPDAALRIQSAAANGQVALLFGSEKTGLSNEELSHCDLLLTIPMHLHPGMRHASMNLGQAVAVCLWELLRPSHAAKAQPGEPARAEDLERIHALLGEVLDRTEYTRRHPATSGSAHIRRLVHRMSLTAPDIPAWLGILRQILWKLSRTND